MGRPFGGSATPRLPVLRGGPVQSRLKGTLRRSITFLLQEGLCSGATPYWLIQAADALYGVTGAGGATRPIEAPFQAHSRETNNCVQFLRAVICADGSEPICWPRLPSGNFYGVTFHGGSTKKCQRGCGTVFEITSTGLSHPCTASTLPAAQNLRTDASDQW